MVSLNLNFQIPLRDMVCCWSVVKVALIGIRFSSKTFGSCQGSIAVFFWAKDVTVMARARRNKAILFIFY